MLSTFTIPRQAPQQLAVQATLVDETKTKSAQEARAREERERKAEQARQQRQREEKARVERERKAAAERERKARVEQERKAKAERERKARVEAEKQAKAKAEQERKARVAAEAEAKRVAEQRAREEAERQAKAEADRLARIEAEKKAKAEAERQARLEAERKAKAEAEAAAARRQSELMAAMEAEERLIAARTSGELAQYIALIRQRVERNWAKPPGAGSDIECQIYVSQIPGGEVTGVRIGRCNADATVVRSIEAAVRKSSPLPVPDNPALFERNLLFMFKPDE